MEKLPEFVFLITVDSEWPVSAVADGPYAVDAVQREVERRRAAAGSLAGARVRVWRAALADAVEMELEPARTVPATLQVKPTGANIR